MTGHIDGGCGFPESDNARPRRRATSHEGSRMDCSPSPVERRDFARDVRREHHRYLRARPGGRRDGRLGLPQHRELLVREGPRDRFLERRWQLRPDAAGQECNSSLHCVLDKRQRVGDDSEDLRRCVRRPPPRPSPLTVKRT